MVSEKFAPEISLHSGLSAIPRGVPFSPYGTCCSVDFCSLCLYLKQKQGGGCSAIFMWYWIMLREKSFFCVKELRFYTTEQVGLYSFLSPFVNLTSFISTLWVSRNCDFYKICPYTRLWSRDGYLMKTGPIIIELRPPPFLITWDISSIILKK